MASSLKRSLNSEDRLVRAREELKCPLCLETLRDPVTTNCAHAFCRACLTEMLHTHVFRIEPNEPVKEPRCPSCREPIHSIQSNPQLAGAADAVREEEGAPQRAHKHLIKDTKEISVRRIMMRCHAHFLRLIGAEPDFRVNEFQYKRFVAPLAWSCVLGANSVLTFSPEILKEFAEDDEARAHIEKYLF